MLTRILPPGSKRREIFREKLLLPKIPRHIGNRFLELDESRLNRLRQSLEKNFFSRNPPHYLSTQLGKQDLKDHLTGRLDNDRRSVIPWLDDCRRLEGAKILEVGCGTGASTVSLAEQGAEVTCLDIDELALRDAEERCKIYGLRARIIRSSATEIRQLFSKEHFDIVVFYASLEHMTHDERMIALSDSWQVLPRSGVWCVIDTPNRLWHFDSHTSNLPFFHWLPDDVAFKYSRFSPRETFNSRFRDHSEASDVEFMRWGRGVSFHEVQIAITDACLTSACVSSLSAFVRRKRVLSRLKWRFSTEHTYQGLMNALEPQIDAGFFEPYLNLIIRKP